MFDAERVWTIFALFLIGAVILGALLPTVTLTMAAAAAYGLGFLLLVLMVEDELRAEIVGIAVGNAVTAALIGHIVKRWMVHKEGLSPDPEQLDGRRK